MTTNQAFLQTFRNMKMTLPMIFGVVLFIGLILQVIPDSIYSFLNNESGFIGLILSAVIGGIVAGSPATSYVFGGEFILKGVSVASVAAFLAAWVTIGFVQFPAESMMLGKKFSLARNTCAFISSILIGVLTGILMGLFA